MERVKTFIEQVKEQVTKVILGQEEIIEGILTSILVGGHVLLEGPPGVAKTLMAKAISQSLSATYRRVQFTPDLMPLDITGTNIFDFQKQQFTFKSGPIFTDLLLADEINRTPPKTQAALLEAMEEKQVTIDGEARILSPIFTVLATQNPIEYEGTYPLPEAQLDRFLLKLQISYPDEIAEIDIYKRYQNRSVSEEDIKMIKPVVEVKDILAMRNLIKELKIREEIIAYIHEIIKATRQNPLLLLGASPRAGVYLLLSAKTYAAMQGRDYVIPEDIQEMALPVLRHRLLVKPEAQIDGKNSDLIIKNIIHSIKVPR